MKIKTAHKNLVLIFITITGIVFFYSSCKKSNPDYPGGPCPACPVIESISPTTLSKGDTVKIKGKNFSTDIFNDSVIMNGKTAEICFTCGNSETVLYAIVPPRTGPGELQVFVNGDLESNTLKFKYDFSYTSQLFAGHQDTMGNSGNHIENIYFHSPTAICKDKYQNIYILNGGNAEIKRIDVSGNVRTIYNGSSDYHPYGLNSSPDGEAIYITTFQSFDNWSKLFRCYAGSTDFIPISSNLFDPTNNELFKGLAIDNSEDCYFPVNTFGSNPFIGAIKNNGSVESNLISDYYCYGLSYFEGDVYIVGDSTSSGNNFSIIKKNLASGNVEPIGNNILGNCGWYGCGLQVNISKEIFITEGVLNDIIKISANGSVSRITDLSLNGPYGLLLDESGDMYVTEFFGHCIKKIIAE